MRHVKKISTNKKAQEKQRQKEYYQTKKRKISESTSQELNTSGKKQKLEKDKFRYNTRNKTLQQDPTSEVTELNF